MDTASTALLGVMAKHRNDVDLSSITVHTYIHTHTHMDCAVGTTDRFLSSVSPFTCVESDSGVADPGAAAARPGTRVVEWLCAELPDCSSMLDS